MPELLDLRVLCQLFLPFVGGERVDPLAGGSDPNRLAGDVDRQRLRIAVREPEVAFRSDDFVRELVEQVGEALRVERPSRLEDERGDSVFFLGGLVGLL